MMTAKPRDEFDAALLDRMVDGEIDDRQQREVLARLDDEPDGWRRLALAFVEAQVWRNELRCEADAHGAASSPVASSPTASSPTGIAAPLPVTVPRGPSIQRPDVPRWNRALAIAASILVAFTLGLVSRGYWPRGGIENGIRPSSGDQGALFDGELAEGAQIGEMTAAPLAAGDGRGRASAHGQPTIRLAVQGRESSIDLPLVDAADVDPRWLNSPPTAVPRHVQTALERTGYRVQQQRQIVPIDLEDGRKVFVPVDQIEVQFVGHKPIQ
jgi:hypothetical protein